MSTTQPGHPPEIPPQSRQIIARKTCIEVVEGDKYQVSWYKDGLCLGSYASAVLSSTVVSEDIVQVAYNAAIMYGPPGPHQLAFDQEGRLYLKSTDSQIAPVRLWHSQQRVIATLYTFQVIRSNSSQATTEISSSVEPVTVESLDSAVDKIRTMERLRIPIQIPPQTAT